MSERFIYFNIRARGELPRLICAAAGLEFKDDRLCVADWPGDIKSQAPFGQVPAVVVDNKWYAERFAISLYFARKGGLYPSSGSPLDFLKLDYILMYAEEVWEELTRAFIDRHFNNKPETLPKFLDEILPTKIARFEQILKENGTGYYVGDKLSIVDVNVFDTIEHVVDQRGIAYLDPYPLVKANYEKMEDIEGIKKYRANRPTPESGFDW